MLAKMHGVLQMVVLAIISNLLTKISGAARITLLMIYKNSIMGSYESLFQWQMIFRNRNARTWVNDLD